jgi:hypothetical protein
MENMGINQLANMFMGNPQPLAQKVEQAQQQTKPGQIPPDLEAAIALQKIQEMRQAAQNQQAMQAGGPQPTVVDKLRQMAQPQMQAQPQGMPPQMQAPQGMPQGMPPQGLPQGGMQPVQAAHGGHIAHLMSNLGNNYGGGGIVAFAGEDGSYVDDPMKDYLRSNSSAAPRTPAQIAAERLLEQSVLTTPEQEEERRLARYKSMVPERDLSGYDRAVEEFEKRRQKLEAPKQGLDAFMEYMQQIAQTPRGLGSLSAGAMGAQKVNELQQNREQQQFDLTKQILEQQQKKAEAVRGDARDKFGIGDAAYNAMFKRNFEAALKITGNELEAEKMARQATDSQLNRENNITLENMRGARQGAPTFADKQKLNAMQSWMRDNPGKTEFDAYQAMSGQASRDEMAREKLNLARSKLMEGNSTYKYAQMAYVNPDTSPEDKAKAKAKMDAIEEFHGIKKPATADLSSSANTMTMADVQATAASSGKTVQEVMAAAKAKGIAVK